MSRRSTAAHQPSPLPVEGFASRDQVRCAFGGISISTLYRWMDEGQLPRPVQLGPGRVGWPVEQIRERIEQLKSQSVAA